MAEENQNQQNEADIRERIRLRAYELYSSRGGQPGSDIEDWLQAEEEIRGRPSSDATEPGL